MDVRKPIIILFGLLYLVGAIFNLLYTLYHSNEFYGSFADKAMLAPSRQFVRKAVIPQAKLFTGLLIAFQLLMALSLLSSGGFVKYELIAGAVFFFSAALVSNASGSAANLSMALVQIFLAFTS